MTLRKVFLIFDREHKLYFAGFSNNVATWSQSIEAAHPYYNQKDADEDYEVLKATGYDVMVEG